ncbi:peptidase M35 [Corallococcus sp. H22C18031201]|nr:peptidase M35 [Citreicoccus inhibens]RJS27910.1 peptidase M35 [Corallococcus sp. H22C18031201]
MSQSLRGGRWMFGSVLSALLLSACGSHPEDESPARAEDTAPEGKLSATVSVPKAALAAGEEVTVRVTLTNDSSHPVKLLKWRAPGAGLMDGRLDITRDGEPVAYTGAHYKRVAPRPQDYVTLEPGESLTGPVAVSGVYDLSRSGTYRIRFELPPRADETVAAMDAPEVSLFIEGRPERRASQPSPQVSSASLAFSGGCTPAQQSTIGAALSTAMNYASVAASYLSAGPTIPALRYTTWFGLYRPNGWSLAKNHFARIQTTLATASLVVDCSCADSGVYAYVYKNQPYNIYTCGAFWNAPTRGSDSKAGTLIHELSHFTVVADTDDFAYGHTGATTLALTKPSQALDNADNHEYFAENTPPIP